MSRSERLPECIQVQKVANGWLVYPTGIETRGMLVSNYTRVARTPEELVNIIYQWTSGEEAMGFELPVAEYAAPMSAAQAQAMVNAVGQNSALINTLTGVSAAQLGSQDKAPESQTRVAFWKNQP